MCPLGQGPAGGAAWVSVADYRYELLGHALSGNLVVEPYLVMLDADAQPHVTFQHPGLKFLYLLSGDVTYRYGPRRVKLPRW